MEKAKLHFQRYEFKYYLPKAKADKLIPTLLKYMAWDPYIQATDQDFYQVNSLYFDSPDYGCFWDKESGIVDRKKLRFRYYNNLTLGVTPIFAEIKRKNDALAIKDRIKLTADQAARENFDNSLRQLLRQDPEDMFLSELLWFKQRNSMQPKLFISYDRKALISKRDQRFRVTFDYNIKARRQHDLNDVHGRLVEVYPEGTVLELKYNNILPVWFHKIIQKYQLQRLAYSKYCNALRHNMPRFDDNNYKVT
ncbi:MAG: hypothetical protein COT81_04665 [Candidatus Buchananbacteria bacterium CG10_big_fil_rev_8_21_14_0_10_42_9]|uniref:VTC domain-containing protein n=1 Tax=Candidatus Buchananbacteria bacterium CG10_big_fil_rev_8_21_14_0_10_42_9 TaxID=1974526 RepID=A0A2H0W2T0_9BACT|nr:MAG: hypothetical protein COT81_04665 [Candidatus Buchananbacteria bacterium CG10_big_fil_rev_8_21_14_0_10_42_9]